MRARLPVKEGKPRVASDRGEKRYWGVGIRRRALHEPIAAGDKRERKGGAFFLERTAGILPLNPGCQPEFLPSGAAVFELQADTAADPSPSEFAAAAPARSGRSAA